MKFGMNLLLWDDHLHDGLLPVIERLKSYGYDGVEIPLFSADVKELAQWSRRLDDMGLDRTAVTIRMPDDNPISPDAKVRAAGVAGTKQILDGCQALGATLLCGPYHSALGLFSGAGPTADEWKWGVECMQPVAEHAARCGVTLAVEAVNRFECYFASCIDTLCRFVKDVNHPSCRMMYDTFHANIEEKNIQNTLRSCKPHLAHVHISENDRSTPGQGAVRWDDTFATLREIGYDGWLTVEAFGLALPAIAAATKIWRRMYESEDQLARDAIGFMRKGMGVA